MAEGSTNASNEDSGHAYGIMFGPAGMPRPGSRDAFEIFDGRYDEVKSFLKVIDQLYAKYRITSAADKVSLVLDYCAPAVKNYIKVTEEFTANNWEKLKDNLLRAYDAEQQEPIYDMTKIHCAAECQSERPITNLKQWKKYVVKYTTRAGQLLKKGRMEAKDHDRTQPYKVQDVIKVAEQHFKQDQFMNQNLKGILDASEVQTARLVAKGKILTKRNMNVSEKKKRKGKKLSKKLLPSKPQICLKVKWITWLKV
ncbi:hypothetical protein JR316_0003279 [Psilocybe cubensis]|uniref:Uncharacterized protein n=1 Tax=Psilocybe cubensis TaxID=181762 RepID=A0ACB8H7B6_PSICU|nr:hypothetical protein JR316_0003279 [Psilocybe cubensis]KAH9483801.1 hypothetical protein JR316_0003279 [Psilocybe cubensis]